MADLSLVYQRSDSLVTRDIAGEKIIVPVRGRVGDLNSIYTLNSVANEIWTLLDGTRTLGQILRQLEDEYDVPWTVLAEDVERVLDELSSEGLIKEKLN